MPVSESPDFTVILPESGLLRPVSVFMRMAFPSPDRPTRPRMSPPQRENDMPDTLNFSTPTARSFASSVTGSMVSEICGRKSYFKISKNVAAAEGKRYARYPEFFDADRQIFRFQRHGFHGIRDMWTEKLF